MLSAINWTPYPLSDTTNRDRFQLVVAREYALDAFEVRPRGIHDAIARGREWIEGMQSRDGGWAAFDVNNLEYYLNNIPFSDHGALLDPPTEDVTARCVSMLAQLGEMPENSPAVSAA